INGLFILLTVAVIVGFILEAATLCGYALCCFIPTPQGARRLVLVALVMGGLHMASDITGGLVAWKMWSDSRQIISDPQQWAEKFQRPTGEKVDIQKEIEQMFQSIMRFSRFSDFQMRLGFLLSAAQQLAFGFFLLAVARSLRVSETAEKCLNFIKLS